MGQRSLLDSLPIDIPASVLNESEELLASERLWIESRTEDLIVAHWRNGSRQFVTRLYVPERSYSAQYCDCQQSVSSDICSHALAALHLANTLDEQSEIASMASKIANRVRAKRSAGSRSQPSRSTKTSKAAEHSQPSQRDAQVVASKDESSHALIPAEKASSVARVSKPNVAASSTSLTNQSLTNQSLTNQSLTNQTSNSSLSASESSGLVPWQPSPVSWSADQFRPRANVHSLNHKRKRAKGPIVIAIDLRLSKLAKLLVFRPLLVTGEARAGFELQLLSIDLTQHRNRYELSDAALITDLENTSRAAELDWTIPREVAELRQRERRYSWADGQIYDVDAFLCGPREQDSLMLRLISKGQAAWSHDLEDASHEVHRLRRNAWSVGQFSYQVAEQAETGTWIMTPYIECSPGQTRPLSDAMLITAGGGILWSDGWTGGLGPELAPWLAYAQQIGELRIEPHERDAAIRYWSTTPLASQIAWPHLSETQFVPSRGKTVVVVRQRIDNPRNWDLFGAIRYWDQVLEFPRDRFAIAYDDQARVVQRDALAEERDLSELYHRFGFDQLPWQPSDGWQWEASVGSDQEASLACISQNELVDVCTQLAEHYEVLLEGSRLRSGGNFQIEVDSGIDWLDVSGDLQFSVENEGFAQAGLPELLAAARKGDRFVRLSDGSLGMIPDAILARLQRLAESAAPDVKALDGNEGTVRFKRSQAMLLDALLASEGIRIEYDASFKRLLKNLKSVRGVKPKKPGRTFQGELREYQQQGLGWFKFLQEFRFGGCLADEMGLGKTVQILALLESRRVQRKTDSALGPSIVVVPKSLLFNWQLEAARFAPQLKVHLSIGNDRHQWFPRWSEFDVIITTYATLSRDIPELLDQTFDYAILDEAQAIKNAQTQASKACRLLKATHRLALTGTPIENHLGELWSLFEFLNPGMLGRSTHFTSLTRNPQPETLSVLARAISPFILRRTKQQVLSDLPDKVQESLYCDLGPKQRKLYNELRDHYRRMLTDSVAKKGLNQSKFVVLEALLRLRQAACHPGLVSAKHASFDSAKFDALLEALPEIIEGGHKAIIFSQFTSLLAMLKPRLKRAGYQWAYLDGQTVNRQAEVERFQGDPNLPLFLISLKAGGHGLNLTAADYVFLLDPWWNPAVEAQAVDRAHRMGQERTVFAYRIIARDTIEEKIALLQESKRAIADSVISENESLLRSLSYDDIKLLFE